MARKKIDWSEHGDEIVRLYVSGLSSREVSQIIQEKYNKCYPSGTLTNFLGRQRALRSKVEAHKLAKAKQIRICEICNKNHTPKNYNQRWCDECTGFKKYRRRMLLHGIPATFIEKMFEEQEHKCKICKKQFENLINTNRKKTLYIDHDHETNQVRGLLCPRCNMALSFIDDKDWHDSAIAYITSAKTNPNPVFVKSPRMRKYARNVITLG